MEFHEKLQALRKQKCLTQEELASQLFVSRSAVSKWESGRGYPGIDSLKAISKLFSVSIDDLLSADKPDTLTVKEHPDKERSAFRPINWGWMDCSSVLMLVFPLFADRTGETIRSVPLLFLPSRMYITLPALLLIFLTVLCGALTLISHKRSSIPPIQHYDLISLLLSGCSVLLFIITLQPYAAALSMLPLCVKVIWLLKMA